VVERAVTNASSALLASATMLVDDISLRGQRPDEPPPPREGIATFVRFRPTEGTEGRVHLTETEVHLLAHAGMMPLVMRFDGALGKASDQSATYERVGAQLTEAALLGQSQTLLVCGAAGAGKTCCSHAARERREGATADGRPTASLRDPRDAPASVRGPTRRPAGETH